MLVRRTLLGWVTLLAVALPTGHGRVAGEEPSPGPAVSLAEVETDPALGATRALAEAHDLLGRGQGAAARQLLDDALERWPDVLVPVPGEVDAQGALRWPVSDVVELLAARLAEGERLHLRQRRREAEEPGLVARVRAGDSAALERLATSPALSPAAREALRLLAEHRREAGRPAEAAHLLERWLRLEPRAEPAERAAVALRLVDARAHLGDGGGLREVLGSDLAQRSESVLLGGHGWTVRERAETSLLALLSEPPAPAAPEPMQAWPPELTRLWRLDLSDAGLRGMAPPPSRWVQPGLWAQEGAVYVNAGRQVRRLDPWTGRQRWAFPPTLDGWDHAPESKYRPHEQPLRCVTAGAGWVLAVLGDPSATGTFRHLDQPVDISGVARESRARLVALDAQTGALRWFTGDATERHPVLGDRACCVSGPPLVVGERVYVCLARRFGVTEHFGACLSLEDGRPLWVTRLGTGENGRDPGARRIPGRDDLVPVRAAPWAARPTVDGDEVCFTPHAGLAAGLGVGPGPEAGRLRWVRALPRFPHPGDGESSLALDAGHSARNAPLAVAGTWVLAPMDSPVVLALEHGSGELRWMTPVFDEAPPWRDLLGIGPDRRGRPAVRLAGAWPALLDPSDGSLLATGAPFGPARGASRALDLGGAVARVTPWGIAVLPWPTAPSEGALRLRLLTPRGEDENLAAADLARAGDVWLCLEPTALSAYVASDARAPGLRAAADDATRPGGERTAAQFVNLGAARAFERLAQVASQDGHDAATLAVLAGVLDDLLRDLVAQGHPVDALDVRALEGCAQRLDPTSRAIAYQRLVLVALAQARPDLAIALLERWLDGPPALIPVELPPLEPPDDPDGLVVAEAQRGLVRSDLVAAGMLRRVRAQGVGVEAFAERDQRLAAELERARTQEGEAPLQQLVARAAASPVLDRAREALLARLLAQRRWGEAAGVAADLRLDAAPEEHGASAAPVEGALQARRLRAAGWQLREAGWLAEAGDAPVARSLLADLLRWVPSGTTDDQGRTASVLAERLRLETGFEVMQSARPTRSLWVWEADGLPTDRDTLRSVSLLGTDGPGAGAWSSRLAVARGLTLELWAADSGKQLARLPGDDEGWFGGGLQDVAAWLPRRGVRVVSLVAGQPADSSGVFTEDWITSWDGRELQGSADFLARLARATPGAPVPVDVRRAGESVLSRFTPGRRPAPEGANVVERLRGYAARDGRLLVPARTGLDWLDPVAATRTACWRWDGSGAVHRAEVRGGLAYAIVRRQYDDDVLVCVEPERGLERWRLAVSGPVMELEASGSALVLQVEDPARTLVVGAHDGRPRAELPRIERRVGLNDDTRVRAETGAGSLGRVWFLRRTSFGRVDLDVADTTTLALRPALRRPRSEDAAWVAPSVSADAFVAVPLDRTRILVVALDPVAGERHSVMTLSAGDLGTDHEHHGGPLDEDSRVLVVGGTVFVVRNSPRRPAGVTVMVFAHDADRPGRLLWKDRARDLLHGASDVLLQDIERYPDGLLLTAMAQDPSPGGGVRRGVLWVPTTERGSERDSGHPPWVSELRAPWRRGAARVGPWIALPTDQGFDLVPLESAPTR